MPCLQPCGVRPGKASQPEIGKASRNFLCQKEQPKLRCRALHLSDMDWEILDVLTTYQTQEGIDGIRDFFRHFPDLRGQAMLLTAPPDSIYLQLIFRTQFGLFYLYALQKYTHSLVYKGWLIRDGFQRLLDFLENLRDEV